MPKVSPAHKAAVRQELIEATARVMVRQDPLTTRAITAEADVSAGTLYNYFESLSELIEAAGEWFLASEWRQFSLELDPSGPYGGLMDVLDEFLFDVPSSGEVVNIPRLRSRVDADEDVYRSIRRYNEFLVDLMVPLVADGAESGHVRERIDRPALVELLDLIRDGLLIRHAQDSYATSFDRVTAVLRTVLTDSVLIDARGADGASAGSPSSSSTASHVPASRLASPGVSPPNPLQGEPS